MHIHAGHPHYNTTTSAAQDELFGFWSTDLHFFSGIMARINVEIPSCVIIITITGCGLG